MASVFTFFVVSLEVLFTCKPIENYWFLIRSISLIDGTLTDTNTPGQSGLRSNGNKGVLHSPQISRT